MPTLASTNRAQLSYLLESVYGTTPATGTPGSIRMTGESFAFALGTEASKEIRSDRQITDLSVVSAGSSGGFNAELSYNEFDPHIEAALQGSWAVYGTNGVGTSFSAAYTSTTITAAVAPTGSSAFTSLAQGQWFRVNHPTNANDGKYFKVHATTAPTSTVITLDATTPAVVAASASGAQLQTSRLANGTTQRSFTIERVFTDVSQYFAYRGMVASKADFNWQSGQMVTFGMDYVGKDLVRGAVTTMPAAAAASKSFDVQNAVSGVGGIYEGGSLLTSTFIKSVSLEIDNKLRGQTAVGTLGNVGVGSGTVDVKGTLEVYLADGTLYDKFVANTASSLSLRSVDGAGNGYVFTLPKVKYSDAKVMAGSKDQDAMLSLPFQGLMDTTTGKTIIIDRVGVAAT